MGLPGCENVAVEVEVAGVKFTKPGGLRFSRYLSNLPLPGNYILYSVFESFEDNAA